MKVLLVIDSLGSGGAQNQLVILAKGLKKKEVECTVFTYQPGDFFSRELSSVGINIIHKKKKGKLGFAVIKALASEIKKGVYSEVISFLDTPNFYNCAATKLSRAKVSNVVSYRSATDHRNLTIRKKIMYRWINASASGLVSNSNHERLGWTDRYSSLSSKFHTIYNGFSSDIIERKNDHSTTVKKLLLVGKLRAPKNVDLLLSVLEKFSVPGIEVHWYGGTSFPSATMQSYADKIKKRSKKLEVKWYWHEPTSEIKQLYKDFDLLVHPSILEGLPNVICEAMMAGLPVLASRILDHPYLLDNDERLLFDPTSEQELFDRLINFVGLSREERIKISEQLSERARSLFDIDKMIESYLDILKKSHA